MAYYTFESIANVDLIAKMIKDAIDDAASDSQYSSFGYWSPRGIPRYGKPESQI